MSLDKATELNLDGADISVAIVASRFNSELVDALLDDVLQTFAKSGVPQENVRLLRVAGASEIPAIAGVLANTSNYDVIVALGVVIAGDTPHHIIIGESVAHALQKIAVDTAIPVINGVIVANTREQAEARTIGKIRRGVEFGECAIDTANVAREVAREYAESLDVLEYDDEIQDGFLEGDDFENSQDDFPEFEGGAIGLPEDDFDASTTKKRSVQRNRKPRRG